MTEITDFSKPPGMDFDDSKLYMEVTWSEPEAYDSVALLMNADSVFRANTLNLLERYNTLRNAVISDILDLATRLGKRDVDGGTFLKIAEKLEDLVYQ